MTTPFRTFALSREIDAEARTVGLACSSEEPYRRWWGVEILDHSAGSIDLSRLADGRHPLLLEHDWSKQIGVVESVEVSADRRLRATARFSRGALGEEILQDVADGIRSLVSIGYSIDELQEERDGHAVRTLSFTEFEDEMRARHGADFDFTRGASDAALANADDFPTFRVTRWQPYEISIVPIPADATVGVGRAAGAVAAAAAVPQQTTTTPTEKIMSDVQVTDNAAEEKARINEIRATAQAFAKYDVAEMAMAAISDGKSVAEFQRGIMDKITTAPSAPAASEVGLTKAEQGRYSVTRAIRAMVDRDWSGAGFEREVHQAICKRAGIAEAPNGGFYVPYEIQKRDMTTQSNGAGGYLVATDNLAASFIDLLRNRAVVAQLGATMLPGLQGNVTIPKLSAAGTAYWLANDTTAITESNQTVGQLALSPKNVGAYTEVSRQLLMQSAPAIDSLVMNDLAKVLALAIDVAALEGNGSGAPVGIANTGGIGSVTGTSMDYADILEFQTDVAGSNALAANCAFVTTPAVAALLKARVKVASTYSPIWEGGILDGTVDGFKAMSTLQVTAASMIFGDFSQVVIGEWGMLELALNPYANFAASISGIRAIQTVDVGIRQAGAFSRATSIT